MSARQPNDSKEERRAQFKEPQDVSVRAPDCAKLADEKDGLIGTLFAGKYSIEARLGVGGMSVVYKAVDVGLRREAAIKILSRQQLEKETSMVRFQQEARAASNINHPGIVRIFEFGLSDDGQPFLAMEYVKGKTLSEEIELAGRMAPARAIGILTQTCQALDHAHRRGVVHRDLKPSNIMLVRGDKDEELARIVDFGIAKLEVADAESYKLTQTGEIFGSPLYMSPEQCRGQRTNLRSDIYSLACVLYEMLTGEPPFVGVNVLDTMRRHIEEEPISLKERGVQYKHLAELSAVLKRAMAKDPARRYGSMEEFEADLTRVLRGQTSNAERSATADSAAYMAARSAAEPALPVFENAAGSNNSRTQFAIAFAAATLVSVCALSAFLVFRRHEPHRPVTTSSSSPSSADKEFQQKIWTAAQQNGESSLPVADKLLDYARFLHDEKR
ncbi:MAG TPA: serine/threonine-protein kinase, partial [Chroococcales cyanobacterium]